MYEIIPASTPEHIETARTLFREYAAAIEVDLCFQNFEQELASLPGKYAPPDGALLLLMSGTEAAGCIALRPLDRGVCEMKRLYLRPSVRGSGQGRRLVDEIISRARTRGYRAMRLDTIPGRMDAAISLYRSLGFREISAYTYNPVPGALYLELTL